MDRFLRMNAAGMGMGQSAAPTDAPVVDTAEQVYISSLALLKMLKHGRAGNKLSLIGTLAAGQSAYRHTT
jgi:26S proteasome regulatory subunit N11